MDTIGSYKEALKRSFNSGGNKNNSFYSLLKTDAKNYRESKPINKYGCSERLNYVNPFIIQASQNQNNTPESSLEREGISLPIKNECIESKNK